jgi:Zn-dependent peptidase ImmA (M78 family)
MIDGSEFNSLRLSLARRRRGLKKTQLASLIGVDLRSITAYEGGEFAPDDGRLDRIADVLRFPRSFFFGPDLEELDPDIASFRAMKSMSAAQRDVALGSGTIALMLNEWFEERFELPAADLPDLSTEDDPEGAAETLRRLWDLGQLPIRNVVHLLESRGVRVFSLAIDAKQVDAFSMWHGSTPFVFLNTRKSSEHSRFDAAHELGHLVLHRHGSPQGQDAERQANAFASAFLMPRSGVIARAPRFVTVDHLVQLKKAWIVSVAALAYRMHSLRLLSDWHYRQLAIQIAKRGYRRSEPHEAPRETSQVLAKIFATLRDDGIGKSSIASQLNLVTNEVDQLVFGLTLTGIEGRSGQSTPSKANLRSV